MTDAETMDAKPPSASAALTAAASRHNQALLPAAFAAIGIVFGDIGTSPLYTLKTVLAATQAHDPHAAIGAVSLIVWTLVIIACVKYAGFAMRIDNDGEGGILALTALLARRARRPAVLAIGLLGAALIYGDGAITPAISVLSALEGLDLAAPSLADYELPMAIVVLFGLFAIQPLGTAWIGRFFGPIMTLWFLTIGVLGIFGIAQHPSALWALSPTAGIVFLAENGMAGFLVLGGVFLCVTGAEALYADMGHFGPRPIKLAWYALAFPALVLNYAGQGAIILGGAPTDGNIFFRLCPPALTLPLVILSTLATIIASQSIITGAFSMSRQAIRLGWMPRMTITQTSAEGYGQIYVGPVNWLLMIVTLGLTIGFRKSDNLAAAYGIAVSGTMLLTTFLLFTAMREIWKWGFAASAAAAGFFLVVDVTFFLANSMKILDGGYVPLLLAAAIYVVMWIWHRGADAVAAHFRADIMPVSQFMEMLKRDGVARVKGTAVFLTRSVAETPPLVVWHVEHNKSLQESVLALMIENVTSPYVASEDRLTITQVAPGFWRAKACFGFMERPDIREIVKTAADYGCGLDLSNVTYYAGIETPVPQEDRKGLPRWLVKVFAAFSRNGPHVTDVFRLPPEQVVELGRQVQI